MEQALPIFDCDFDSLAFESGDLSALSAEQYLAWVRHQAEQLPDVVRADVNTEMFNKNQTQYMPRIDDISACPEHLTASPDWEKEVLASFSELRTLLGYYGARGMKQRKQPVPPMRDSKAWQRFCIGPDTDDIESDETSDQEGDDVDESIVQLSDPSLEDRKRKLYDALDQESEWTVSGNEEKKRDNISNNDNNISLPDVPIPIADSDTCNMISIDITTPPPPPPSEGGEEVQPPPPLLVLPVTYLEGVSPTPSLLMQFDQVMTQKVLSHHVSWLERKELSVSRAAWIYALLARLEKPLYQDTAAVVRNLYRICSESESIAVLNLLITISGLYFSQGEICCISQDTNNNNSTSTTSNNGNIQSLNSLEGGEIAMSKDATKPYTELDWDGGAKRIASKIAIDSNQLMHSAIIISIELISLTLNSYVQYDFILNRLIQNNTKGSHLYSTAFTPSKAIELKEIQRSLALSVEKYTRKIHKSN
eukprot:gene2007-3902_t